MSETRIPISDVSNVKGNRKRAEVVSLRAYSLESVKKTCYRYANSGFVKLDIDDRGQSALVHFRFPTTVDANQEQQIIDSFNQDLVDQDLREIVSKKTEVIRNLIFANAFANTSLTDDE